MKTGYTGETSREMGNSGSRIPNLMFVFNQKRFETPVSWTEKRLHVAVHGALFVPYGEFIFFIIEFF